MQWLYDGLLDSALVFSFLSGALISLAGNFATSALLWTTGQPVSRATLYRLGLFLTIASIGSFCASSALESARRTWEAKGAVPATRSDYLGRYGLHGFAWGILLMITGLVCAFITFARS
jgi:hypothetical protein